MKDGETLKDMVYGPPIFIPAPVKDKAGNEHKTRGGMCEFCGVHWKKCGVLQNQVVPEGHEIE